MLSDYTLCYVGVAAGGSGVQRRPSLAVNLVHFGTVVQEEHDNFQAAVDAGLWGTESPKKETFYTIFHLNLQGGEEWGFHLMKSSDAVSVGAVYEVCHAVLVHHLLGLLQHHFGLLRVPTCTCSQEFSRPVKPHPFPTDAERRQRRTALLKCCLAF